MTRQTGKSLQPSTWEMFSARRKTTAEMRNIFMLKVDVNRTRLTEFQRLGRIIYDSPNIYEQ